MPCPAARRSRPASACVTAAAELFRRQGYAATGIKAILTAAGAPYGSLYHFFPGGKAELGRAVIEEGGLAYLALVEAFFRDDVDPVAATEQFFAGGAELLESTGFADACPIATIAGEIADTHEPMRVAAAAAFDSWIVHARRPPRRATAPSPTAPTPPPSSCSASSKARSCSAARPARPSRCGWQGAGQWRS